MSHDTISLELTARQVSGKAVKHLRREGQIPAVIHDHGKESVVVQGDGIAMLKAYRQAGKNHPIQLKADGKTYTAMIKIAEFEPRKHQLNHIVFNAVSANQKVEAEVPVHPQYAEGNEASPAERSGLMVITTLDVVLVEGLPNNLPDALYYDAEKLVEVGDHISVADLNIPADIEVKTELSQGVASVYEPSAVAAANDAAGGDAEPEEEPAEASEESADESADDEAEPKSE